MTVHGGSGHRASPSSDTGFALSNVRTKDREALFWWNTVLIIIFKAKCLLNISLACAEKRKLGGGAGRMNHHLISASSLAQLEIT